MLRHSNDSEPGFTRRKAGQGWQYFDDEGARVTDRATVDRLNALALPPAYTDAWFCKDANGHIQATGKDARGRKQYRYHADFRAKRDASKYEGCIEFGQALPRLRARVEKDLRKRSLTREAVIAAVVRLLDKEHVRIGNEQYARANKSFGATTLRTRHVKDRGRTLTMRFTGKHGIVHELKLTDSNLKRVVRRCQELPGQMLFQYEDDAGEPRAVTSADVNAYIREATGCDFTAKHFRTWGASVIFYDQLLKAAEEGRISLKTALEPVAEALGNTPTMARNSYVHPRLVDAVKEDPGNPLGEFRPPRARKRLSPTESRLLAFLKSRPKRRRKVA